MIKVYDFFSGCGGASRGFQDAGFEINLGIDINVYAAKTFKINFPKAHFIQKDIREIDFSDIDQYIVRNPKDKVLFCGCAPCQPFSKQNRQKNNSDSRINLLQEFARFVKHYIPDYIFVENVPGIQKFSLNKTPLEDFVRELEQMGYSYAYKVVSAADYGVPQPRKRLILIAALNEKIYFPKQTHGEAVSRPYSVIGDWIKDLPKLHAGDADKEDEDHVAASLSALNLLRIKNTPEGGGRSDWPEALKLKCHNGHKGHTDVYGRLSYNKMASTLTTRCTSYSNGRYGHPTQNRAISIREAACIQTFPRTFHFIGTSVEKARQIGNAVPPLLAYKFAQVFRSLEKLNR